MLVSGYSACLSSPFSAAGAYLASSGQDNKVIVWVTDKASVLVSKDFEARVISMHWKPDANTLLGMSLAGQVILWEEVIPNGEVMPCEAFEKAAREVVEDAEPSEGIQRSMHADQSEGEPEIDLKIPWDPCHEQKLIEVEAAIVCCTVQDNVFQVEPL